MATQSLFHFLNPMFNKIGENLQAPSWLINEVQHRIVLLLNHVLQQEQEATLRLKRHQGRSVLFQWRSFRLQLLITPAGLLDTASAGALANLTVEVQEPSVFGLAQSLAQRQKPTIRIEGDVQLAAEINWLVDHVRWDLEEDLARLIGDAPAHRLAQLARQITEALNSFFAKVGQADTAESTPDHAAQEQRIAITHKGES